MPKAFRILKIAVGWTVAVLLSAIYGVILGSYAYFV